jgi:hypothetical protein
MTKFRTDATNRATLKAIKTFEPDAHCTYHSGRGSCGGFYSLHVWGREISEHLVRSECLEQGLQKLQSAESATEHDVGIARMLLVEEVARNEEYCTNNVDHADGAAHLIDEIGRTGYEDEVEEWVSTHYDIDAISPDCYQFALDSVCDELGSTDADAHNDGNPGKACCVYRLDEDGQEVQIDVTGQEGWRDLHDRGVLNDCLDQIGNEFTIGRSRWRVQDPQSGHYYEVGSKDYGSKDEHPTFEIYTDPDCNWAFYVSYERMFELFSEGVKTWNDDNPQDDDDDYDE